MPPLTVFGLIRTAATACRLQEGTVGIRLILSSDHRLVPPPADLVFIEFKHVIAAGPGAAGWLGQRRPCGDPELFPKPLTADLVRLWCAKAYANRPGPSFRGEFTAGFTG